VKVVQRIPVKIILNPGQNSDDYLRLGMSVEPKVYVKYSRVNAEAQLPPFGSGSAGLP
jgi:multidrug resistance efflux pump